MIRGKVDGTSKVSPKTNLKNLIDGDEPGTSALLESNQQRAARARWPAPNIDR